MRRVAPVVLALAAALGSGPQGVLAAVDRGLHRAAVTAPLSFEPNLGQTDARALYVARDRAANLFVVEDGLVLGGGVAASGCRPVRLRFTGGATRDVVPSDLTPRRVSAFLGDDPACWVRDAPTWATLTARSMYPGIDVVYRALPDGLELDFVIAPDGDASTIRLAVEGASAVELDASGSLLIRTQGGDEVSLPEPVAWVEEGAERRRPVDVAYALEGTSARLEVRGARPGERLVIDPVLRYGTYSGGSDDDRAYGLALDSLGDAYVAGSTMSLDYPVTDGGVERGGIDAFVTKVSPTGVLLYSAYFGGSGNETIYSIAVDQNFEFVVVGSTSSPDLPLANPISGTLRGNFDAFVTRFNALGTALVFSSYLGCVDAEAHGVALDASGAIYMVGDVSNNDLPVVNAFQPAPGGASDVFVTKLSAGGLPILYSSYLGGESIDFSSAIAVDPAGGAYVVGYTRSARFPTTGGVLLPSPPDISQVNGFLTHVAPAGTSVVYSTYIAGVGGATYPVDVLADVAQYAYVSGVTGSPAFPLMNPVQGVRSGGGDSFLSVLNPAGSGLLFSTYLGGSDYEDPLVMAFTPGVPRTVWIAGGTSSDDFPLLKAQQSRQALADGYVGQIDTATATVLFLSYFGGHGDDRIIGIASDGSQEVTIAGTTESVDIPTRAAFRPFPSGGADAFVARFAPSGCWPALPFVEGLKMTRGPGLADVRLGWPIPPWAGCDSYEVWRIDGDKRQVPNAGRPGNPPVIVGVPGCSPVQSLPACIDVGALPGPPGALLFYAVRAGCGPTEGP